MARKCWRVSLPPNRSWPIFYINADSIKVDHGDDWTKITIHVPGRDIILEFDSMLVRVEQANPKDDYDGEGLA